MIYVLTIILCSSEKKEFAERNLSCQQYLCIIDIMAINSCPLVLVIFANNLDTDDAPQNVGPHLRSILFDTQIIY